MGGEQEGEEVGGVAQDDGSAATQFPPLAGRIVSPRGQTSSVVEPSQEPAGPSLVLPRLGSGSSQMTSQHSSTGQDMSSRSKKEGNLWRTTSFTTSLKSFGGLRSSPREQEREEMVDTRMGQDWRQVLKGLQKERKRDQARIEEHYVKRSLFCLEPYNPLREQMIKLVELDLFNQFVLALIF